MYISTWDEFQKAAEDIYIASPELTRYVHTFHRSDGELVLKVTDDRTNVKYKTNQMTDLKKFIALNNVLMLKMMNKEATPDEDTVIPDAAPLTKHAIPEVVASPKQTPKSKKGKKRR